MEPRPIPHTDLPGASRLFADFLYQFDRVRHFYGFSPRESASYSLAAGAVRYPDQRRAALVAALRAQNGDHPSLDLLARPNTSVVATGQQVGLFSGPAYSIYKALTAARLAQRLTEQGIASVPVFWLASEDHDFAEVNHCWVFNGAHHPVRVEAAGAGRSAEPVGRIPITGNPVEGLRRALDGLPFAGQVIALAEDACAPGCTFATAFRDLLKKLLSSYGLLYLDPLDPAIRELARPVLRQAVESASDLVSIVLERNRELETAGYHAQVRVEPQSSLLFLLERGRRLPLGTLDNGFVSAGRRFSAAELLDRAVDLSPNALLRPVVQDYIMPTVASVVGPAEAAYLAQAQVLYQALLGRMPVVVPRGSFTLLDVRTDKLMRRYGLSLADFIHGEEALRERIAAQLVPPALGRTLEDTAAETGARIDRLHALLMSFDPTLAEAAKRSRRKILYQLDKIQRKVSREALRRNQRAADEAAWLCALLYPHKHLQERFYSILPFLAEHGLGLIDTIYENLRLDSPDHQVLVV